MLEKLNEKFLLEGVLRGSDLRQVKADQELITKIPGLMTPEEILGFSYFPPPEPILPDRYQDFDSLLSQRDRIRTLGLLPIKSEEVHQAYRSQLPEQLMDDVQGYLGGERLALSFNNYPYWLPGDLRQYLLWVGEDFTERPEIVDFCAKAMTVLKLKQEDVILFERSRQASGRLLRGTFKPVRHIHFWMKNKGNE